MVNQKGQDEYGQEMLYIEALEQRQEHVTGMELYRYELAGDDHIVDFLGLFNTRIGASIVLAAEGVKKWLA